MEEVHASEPKVERYITRRRRTSTKPLRTSRSASPRARMAALKTIEAVEQGKKPNIREISLEVGYSAASAKGHAILSTHDYQRAMVDHVQKMEMVRLKALDAMLRKNYDVVTADKLSTILKNITHDIQLLTGGKTENTGHDEDRDVIQTILHEIREVSNNDGEGTKQLPEAAPSV